MSIAIVTDTDSSLPAEVAAQYGIHLVPINVHFGQEVFATGTDIDDEQVFERVDREGQLPTTSAPTPGQFFEAYEAAFQTGADGVVCICVSAAVSGTYNAALTAREMMAQRDVTVVDSKSLSMGQGFMALAAAEAARAGESHEAVIAQAQLVGQRTHLYAALPTLKYLAMSGRVGHLVAGMATLLNVKPILTIQDGKLDMLERVRTWRRARERVVKLVAQVSAGKGIERMALVHVNALHDARQVAQAMQEAIPCPEVEIEAQLTPGLSVHAGAGMVGITIVVGDE